VPLPGWIPGGRLEQLIRRPDNVAKLIPEARTIAGVPDIRQRYDQFSLVDPGALPPFAAWQALHAYSVGAFVLDSNGIVQECTVAGTSGPSTPTWNSRMTNNILGGTTSDGGVTWTNIGPPAELVNDAMVRLTGRML